MKIRSVEGELFHADGCTDGQTDMAKLTVISCNFATAPKNLNFAHTHLNSNSRLVFVMEKVCLLSGKGKGVPVHAINQEQRPCPAYSYLGSRWR